MELTTSDVYLAEAPTPGGDGAAGAGEAMAWPPPVYSPGREAGDRALAREIGEALEASSRPGGEADVTAVARRPDLLRRMARRGGEEAGDRGADAVAAVEGPGLVLAVPLALEAGLPLVVLRRPGPAEAGGEGALEADPGALERWSRVLLVEAVLDGGEAVGGAARAVEEAGPSVAGIAAIADLRPESVRGGSSNRKIFSFIDL